MKADAQAASRKGIATTLPESEVEKILALVRSRTDEQIVSFRDGARGPEVKTGHLYGHVWQVRRAPAGWKILRGDQPV